MQRGLDPELRATGLEHCVDLFLTGGGGVNGGKRPAPQPDLVAILLAVLPAVLPQVPSFPMGSELTHPAASY